MNKKLIKNIIIFLFEEIHLDLDSIELVLKLSKRHNISLPILLWNYGFLNIEELDKLYSFLFKNLE